MKNVEEREKVQMKNWDDVVLVPEFDEQGVACYRLEGGDYENEYYVISEAESRKLLNTPEIVGYEVYNCLVSSTSQMLYYFKEKKKLLDEAAGKSFQSNGQTYYWISRDLLP